MSDKSSIPSISSSRIMIRYAEDGGGEKDNVIEIRPGVEDLSLGDRAYACVRILVDKTHYLKGMAIYATKPDLIPLDIDIVFNTSKSKASLPSPFYSCIRGSSSSPFDKECKQWTYQDDEGNTHISPLNIVNDNHDWDKWAQKTRIDTALLMQLGDRQGLLNEFAKV